jgi:hypothetical protein
MLWSKPEAVLLKYTSLTQLADPTKTSIIAHGITWLPISKTIFIVRSDPKRGDVECENNGTQHIKG